MPDSHGKAEESRIAKITLRNRLLTARRTLSAADRTAAALAVHLATTTLVRRRRPATVAAYVPVGAEPGGPDLPGALTAALPRRGRLLLPVLRPDLDLDWAHYTPGTLTAGPRGLSEPSGARLGVDAVREAELLIVPALAVGRDGTRLGRGGGSYDRALARAGNAVLVALLHDGELLDTVPAEPHDVAVHAVITPADGLVVLRHF
ncbi:MAG TPA: 5-formyltetrahydrofolate cyclo-ligase [Actinoplanes sp.]|nr:5-formyltetrahydrofolate cyclo-ligase [Actinoplanes sp.]